MKGVLFIRKFPSCLAPSYAKGLERSARSVFGAGQWEIINGHKVVFLFPGLGKKIRKIPSTIVAAIDSGEISDVVDFGATGALDPGLRVGDMVLSEGEVCCNGSKPFPRRCRNAKAREILQSIAIERRRKLWEGKILTSDKVVARASERIDWLYKTEAIAVQMEHFWFVQKLQQAVTQQAFDALYFTHVELIADEVPQGNATLFEKLRAIFKALDICVFRNDFHLGRLKLRFLQEFLE